MNNIWDDLTPAQSEALCKAWSILCEHFDSCIVAFETEVKEGTDKLFDANYHGGVSNGIGLAERTKHKLLTLGSEQKDEWDNS